MQLRYLVKMYLNGRYLPFYTGEKFIEDVYFDHCKEKGDVVGDVSHYAVKSYVSKSCVFTHTYQEVV
jgi:hypothetical protein